MLLENGIQPDILVLRTERSLSYDLRRKVALFCNVNPEAVIESIDVSTIYEVPVRMLEEKLDLVVLEKLKLPVGEPDLKNWMDFLSRLKNPKHSVKIGLVGKYVELPDAYKSIAESFIHSGSKNECHVELCLIHSEELTEKNLLEKVSDLDGIVVAPGFGSRGIEGKILAVRYARENNIPFFGICLGMQCAVIEFARNVMGFAGAHSTEIDPEAQYPVIDLMEEQKRIVDKIGRAHV